jgi:ABC-type transport system involved in multi-copper enzyme maturation permease subunit
VGVEFRLLLSERSLVVIMPLAIFLSILEVAFHNIPPDVSHSAAYATNTGKLLLLFLVGMTVFYTGEAMHRDREVRIESVLWATPTSNSVLLLSKFLTTLFLTLFLITLVGLAASLIQLFRGQTPVEISAYLITYSVVLLPTIVFTTAASIGLNVLLREKYFVYAVSIAIAGGLLYLYNLGHNHWLYNPALYRLWTYSDLIGQGSGRILMQRIYWLALSCLFLALAHLGFQRKSAKGFRSNGRLGSAGWALVVTVVSLVVAVIAGLRIK